jgi:hypothetical protein
MKIYSAAIDNNFNTYNTGPLWKKRRLTEPSKKVLQKSKSFQKRRKSQKHDKNKVAFILRIHGPFSERKIFTPIIRKNFDQGHPYLSTFGIVYKYWKELSHISRESFYNNVSNFSAYTSNTSLRLAWSSTQSNIFIIYHFLLNSVLRTTVGKLAHPKNCNIFVHAIGGGIFWI